MPRALRAGLAAVACMAAMPLLAPVSPAAADGGPSVLLAFLPAAAPTARHERPDRLLRAFAARPSLDVGLLSATQGNYSPEQELLDITQGIRVSPTAYRPNLPVPLRLIPSGQGGRIDGWRAAVRRAHRAPASIRPGLLASSIPSGAAYVGVTGGPHLPAVAAARRGGTVAAVSIGPASTVVARAQTAASTHRLVVVDLPSPTGLALRYLDGLLAAREPDELAIATQT